MLEIRLSIRGVFRGGAIGANPGPCEIYWFQGVSGPKGCWAPLEREQSLSPPGQSFCQVWTGNMI